MPHGTVVFVCGVDGITNCLVVRRVALGNPRLHFGDRELTRIDRLSCIEQTPHQPDPFFGFSRHIDWARPRAVKQCGVNIEQRAIGVDIAARKVRRNEGGAEFRCCRIERLDVSIFRSSQGH